MAKSNTKKYLTFEEKDALLKEVEEGKSNKDILKTYEISKPYLFKIKRDKENILKLSKKKEFKTKKMKRSPNNNILEECLLTWLAQARVAGIAISGPIIQKQALQFNSLLEGSSTFKASNGWLEKFKNRHGIRQPTMKDEILSDNSEAVKLFQEEILKKIEEEDLFLDNIYNADESGIYWKQFPNKTLAFEEEKLASGRTEYKDRVTALFCCNATGTNKIKLCIIGKSANPKAIKNITNLPVIYKSQESGWMSQDLFKEWFENNFIPSALEHQKKNNNSGKILLLLDNAPSHPHIDILNNINRNFEVKYVPPNVTAIVQPMDQNVISITKQLYKKQFISKLLLEEPFNVDNFLNNFTIKDCIDTISKAWQNIQPCTLRKAWKPMLKDLIDTDESSETIKNKESVELCHCNRNELENNNIDVSEIQKWITEEQENDEGWRYLTDAEIVETTINNQEFIHVNCDGNCENFLEENDVPSTNISHMQAYEHLKSLKNWCEEQCECDVAEIIVIDKLLKIATEKAMLEVDQ